MPKRMRRTRVRSYAVEFADGDLIDYTRTLEGAKDLLHRYGGHRILALSGPSFGEGVHMYELVWNPKLERFQYGFR
jgi:hypothetical protein